MPEHISPTLLWIGLAVMFAFRFIMLMTCLLIMIKIQKLDFTWLPLIGSAILASMLDMVPLVGHFIAVPVLYLCIWKITRSTLYPDAAFTVGVSYALVRCLTMVLLAYLPYNPHPKSAQNTNYDLASLAPGPSVSDTNQPGSTVPPPPAHVPEAKAQAANAPDVKNTSGISIKGFSRLGNSALVTIQCHSKIYTISSGEGTTVSTDNGFETVRLVDAGKDDVTLDVGGQTVKYALK